MSDSKVEKVMGEFKEGTLKDSHGNKVTDRDQALAIALSEAGISKSEEMDKNSKEYKEKVRKLLEKYNVNSPEDLSEENKKKFFNELDSMHVSDEEQEKNKGQVTDDLHKAFKFFGLIDENQNTYESDPNFKAYSELMNKGKTIKSIGDKYGNKYNINVRLKKGDQVKIGEVDCIFKGDHYEVTEIGEKLLNQNIEKGKGLPEGTERKHGGKTVVKRGGKWVPKSDGDSLSKEGGKNNS